MKKILFLRIINILMILLFLLTALGVIFYTWVPGRQRGAEWLYEIHVNAGKTFILVALFHIFLNWGWVKNNYLKKRRKK